jgi:hypothetical protein
MGLEHHIELAHIAYGVAIGRFDLLFLYSSVHLGRSHTLWVYAGIFEQMVRTKALLRLYVFYERIGKSTYVTRGLPDILVHEDGRIYAVHIITIIDELLPPQSLDIVLESEPERCVIPRAGKSSVDLRSLENKAATLAESYERIHLFRVLSGIF